MNKPVQALVGLGVALLIVGPITGLKVLQIGNLIAFATEMGAAGTPPTAVASHEVVSEAWEQRLSVVGSLEPVQGVTLAAELGGKVVAIEVESGASVRAGDLLVRLDTATEDARLAAAEASLKLAQINRSRARDLLAQTTISQAEFDTADATEKQAAAEVTNIRSTIDKKAIRAPFAGRVGIRRVNLGQTLREGDLIIPLQALNPIYVDFSVPQQHVSELSVGQKLRVTVAGVPGEIEGTVTAVNPEVDVATRSLRVQGTIANPQETLRPGMYANIGIVLPTTDAVLAVPLTAVVHAPYGDSVFVVDQKDGKPVARQQFVRLGRTRGDFVAVVDGLKAGERVVSAGAFKLTNGAPLMLNDAMQPTPSTKPAPKNS